MIVKLQASQRVVCCPAAPASDYVWMVTWSPQLQQRLTGAQIPYPVSHELSAGRPVELNLSSKQSSNCCYELRSQLSTPHLGVRSTLKLVAVPLSLAATVAEMEVMFQ